MNQTYPVCIIGAGLAGAECAFQLARHGIKTALVEMRPQKKSPAHSTSGMAELVCSNSLRSSDVTNAVGLLKQEMAALNSLIIRAAHKAKVPAGTALAVDRTLFSDLVTNTLSTNPCVTVISGVVTGITQGAQGLEVSLASGQVIRCERCVIATGPLTDEGLAGWICENTGHEYLYFYDAIAPVVEKESIDFNKAFYASRYERGENENGDYINCPMTQAEYEAFVSEIKKAELAEVKDFDRALFFDGCLPIEEMIARGDHTLLFGPMKPVGISSGERLRGDRNMGQVCSPDRPHAVVQLRQDNLHDTLYNMVGFQTRMKWPEQKRIFRMIPGLEQASFARLGAMHRNTYICSPAVLKEGLELKNVAGIFFAGQITGCEGYVESAAAGLMVGLFLSRLIKQGGLLPAPPATTALGALINHILCADKNSYQPMNINYGLFKEIELKAKKFDRKVHLLKRAVNDFWEWYYREF
ncbi:MAG: methylenetetrahydrofolate--tRNA-(uracil(54)-C(5))-methyltransferase (FADH(2)-oxidizing) TrmFO [Deltaproteobacteria bacterium]|nr:methylenetetrahydrofolate--tRNA-(uracil(54)-C(5))-methyltransferase (FADH(2)-oxidizing) TrmFO [Deltaproteobacteria bacterium]